MFFNNAFAFLKKDLLNEMSYKLSFCLQIAGIFVSVAMLFFISRLFGQAQIPAIAKYGGDYFAFVIIGVAFSSYLEVSVNSMSRKIREGQMMGTLEALLATQAELPTIIISSSLYSFLFTSVRVLVYILIGVIVFGLNIGGANYPGAIIILVLSIIAFSSIGILSASFIMIFKKGDPVARIFSSLSWLLGGVYYPIEILPQWLEKVSLFLPITHSLEGMRFALLKGYDLRALMPSIICLILFTVIVMPVSLLFFSSAVKFAKRDGSLTQY